MSNRYIPSAAIACLAVLPMACKTSTEPDTPCFVGFQVPGCQSGLGKIAEEDSCFSFTFRQDLSLEFCATGNCDPQVNRFAITQRIQNDTILVTVADTAAQGAWCDCPYKIHVEFWNLPRDSYLVLCTQMYGSKGYLLCAERVTREWWNYFFR